jgi:acyl-CoA thioester hydrolase
MQQGKTARGAMVTDANRYPGQQADLTPCYWGSVNRWECDENDHLNVRFYAHKINQAIQAHLSGCGVEVAAAKILSRISTQHIRFLREARVATPLRVDCGIIRADGPLVETIALMHHNVTGTVLAAFVSTLRLAATDILAGSARLPDFAAPRGIDISGLPPPPATPADALKIGYRIVGRGVIGDDECDAQGVTLPHAYIGRISDGMPNLWAFINAAEDQASREQGDIGGAALEQRLEIVSPLRAGAVFTQMSGVRALGSKTQQMSHLVYDEEYERLAVRAEAVGVAMDLQSRKALPISPERRQRLEPLLLRGLPG